MDLIREITYNENLLMKLIMSRTLHNMNSDYEMEMGYLKQSILEEIPESMYTRFVKNFDEDLLHQVYYNLLEGKGENGYLFLNLVKHLTTEYSYDLNFADPMSCSIAHFVMTDVGKKGLFNYKGVRIMGANLGLSQLELHISVMGRGFKVILTGGEITSLNDRTAAIMTPTVVVNKDQLRNQVEEFIEEFSSKYYECKR